MSDSRKKLIEIKNLTVRFGSRRKPFTAVNNVSFDIYKGETFGLVGESGCGKSTVGKMIAGLYKPTNGSIVFQDGTDLARLSAKDRRAYSKNIQLIFQDPYAS